MTMFVNGILPLIKSSLNGTTSFHGEIKNTKLIFKRYLIDSSVSRTDFSLSHAVISYKYPHASAFAKHIKHKETFLLAYAYCSNVLILGIKLSKISFLSLTSKISFLFFSFFNISS